MNVIANAKITKRASIKDFIIYYFLLENFQLLLQCHMVYQLKPNVQLILLLQNQHP